MVYILVVSVFLNSFQRNLFGSWEKKGSILINTVVKMIQCMRYTEYFFIEWPKEHCVKSKLELLWQNIWDTQLKKKMFILACNHRYLHPWLVTWALMRSAASRAQKERSSSLPGGQKAKESQRDSSASIPFQSTPSLASFFPLVLLKGNTAGWEHMGLGTTLQEKHWKWMQEWSTSQKYTGKTDLKKYSVILN